MKCLGLLLFLLCLATPFAYADQAGWSVIEDAYKASQNKNYKGIYISQHGQELKSVEITHALHGNEQFTRINLLDGNADEIFSQGDTAVIYHKRDNTIVVQKREQQHLFPAIFPKDINSIKKYYLLSFGKPDRVAGRITQNIVFTPKMTFGTPIISGLISKHLELFGLGLDGWGNFLRGLLVFHRLINLSGDPLRTLRVIAIQGHWRRVTVLHLLVKHYFNYCKTTKYPPLFK